MNMVERFVLKGMRLEPDPGEYWVATRYVYATAYDALAADLAQAKARIASLERRYMDLGELAARYREALVKVKDAKLLTVAHIAAMDALGIDWYRGAYRRNLTAITPTRSMCRRPAIHWKTRRSHENA